MTQVSEAPSPSATQPGQGLKDSLYLQQITKFPGFSILLECPGVPGAQGVTSQQRMQKGILS